MGDFKGRQRELGLSDKTGEIFQDLAGEAAMI